MLKLSLLLSHFPFPANQWADPSLLWGQHGLISKEHLHGEDRAQMRLSDDFLWWVLWFSSFVPFFDNWQSKEVPPRAVGSCSSTYRLIICSVDTVYDLFWGERPYAMVFGTFWHPQEAFGHEVDAAVVRTLLQAKVRWSGWSWVEWVECDHDSSSLCDSRDVYDIFPS